MKQHIIIFSTVLITLILMSFGFIDRDDSVVDPIEASSTSSTATDNQDTNDNTDLDLIYNIDSRYMTTITKEDLDRVTSVLDIVPQTAEDWQKASFKSVTVAILQDNELNTKFNPYQDNDEISAIGDSKKLNANQIKLLRAVDYSTNFHITAYSTTKDPVPYRYFFSVIPQKEAEFVGGYNTLIQYLKEGSKKETAIIEQEMLRPCKVSFTVTKKGTVSNIKFVSTSGYPSVDKTLLELITNMPEKWKSAENSKGEKVDQKLVFFFGEMDC